MEGAALAIRGAAAAAGATKPDVAAPEPVVATSEAAAGSTTPVAMLRNAARRVRSGVTEDAAASECSNATTASAMSFLADADGGCQRKEPSKISSASRSSVRCGNERI